MQKHIPNLLTLLRIGAIAPICWLLWHERFTQALLLLLLAGLTDALDGFLARRFHWTSQLGAFLDPLADKLFIVSVVLVFGFKGYLPWWLVWLVFGRDLIILGGALTYRLIFGDLEVKPSRLGKVNTALQISLLALTLIHVAFFHFSAPLMQALQIIVASSTLLSGASYVYLWAHDANKRHSNTLT